jgi:hypothetical protein
MHERIALLGDLSWTQRLQELARLALARRSYEPFALSKLSEIGSGSRGARPKICRFACCRTELSSVRSGGERVGQGRLELPTLRLSGVRSNHLSYWPGLEASAQHQL